MADNFNFTPGSGATGAADDVSGVLFQRVKLDLGGDGASIPSVAGAHGGLVVEGVASGVPVPTSIPSLLVPDTFKSQKAATITNIATVWTPASGKKVRLMGGTISVSAAVSVLFEDNSAGTDVFQTPALLADTPYSFDLGNGKVLAANNNVLKATSSAAATLTGTLYGTEE